MKKNKHPHLPPGGIPPAKGYSTRVEKTGRTFVLLLQFSPGNTPAPLHLEHPRNSTPRLQHPRAVIGSSSTQGLPTLSSSGETTETSSTRPGAPHSAPRTLRRTDHLNPFRQGLERTTHHTPPPALFNTPHTPGDHPPASSKQDRTRKLSDPQRNLFRHKKNPRRFSPSEGLFPKERAPQATGSGDGPPLAAAVCQ